MKKSDYVHVDVYVKGMMRIMSSLDEMPMFNGYLDENKNLSELIAASKLPEEALLFMKVMNSKLEHIIGLLEHNHMETSFPITIEVINLSATEATFKTNARLETGMAVEVILPLSQMPLIIAGAIGRLEPAEDSRHGILWKLSFTRIREPDMESIVQFVFQQERKRIREIRWE